MTGNMLVISGLDVWSMGSGKGAPSLHRTITGYADAGWQVFFLTGNKTGGSEYDIHPRIKIIRFDLLWIKKFYSWRVLSHAAKNIWWLVFQAAALFYGIMLARREKLNLFYGYDALGVPCSYLLARIFKKPVISRFQGTTIGYFKKQRLWRLKFWDQILALKTPTDLLIMTNDGQEEDKLLKELGVDMSRVKFWMNGVKKDFSLPEDFSSEGFKSVLGLAAESKVVLIINRLHKWKRVDRVIAAMPEIVRGEPAAKLVVVGEGEEYQRLLALAEDLAVREHVLFAGSVVQGDVARFLAIADVFVSCNDSANIGNPLLEAMVSGKCIVTLNNGSTGEVVKNNITGMLLEMDQVDSMGKVIVELLRDEKKRAFLGQNARKYAGSHFWTWPERMAAELALAENLAGQRPAANKKPGIFVMSSVHRWDDPRIFHKEIVTLKSCYQVELHALAPFACREVDGVMVHGLKPYRRSLRCLNWLRLFLRAVRSKANVFHFHDPELIPVGLALRLIKRGKKVIYDIHEHSDATILSREWVPRPLRRPAARLVDKIERATAGLFSGIVVADSRMAEKFTKARHIVEIRNFPQASFGQRYAEELGRDKTATEKDGPVVVYVGVMGKDRGLETVLEAMPMVRSRVPGARCFLVGRVSGSGLSSRYRDNLEEYLAGGNITVTGQVDYEKVMRYLAGSDVGWVPFPPIAKHRWGIGTKLTEYMAMAMPVVASDYGEGAEVVRREKCGILVDPEDPAEHAEAIALLLSDREMASELGQKGREAFLRGYFWEAQGAKLLDFYNKVGGRDPEAAV